MSKIEKEVKILNLDVDTAIERIKRCNGVLKEDCLQKIYTYDLSTIVDRYEELIRIFANRNYEELIRRFGTLFREVDGLLPEEIRQELKEIYGKDSLVEILNDVDNVLGLYNFVASDFIKEIMCKYIINPNKWIRLRQTNDVVTLTIKHIFGQTKDGLQNVKETEMVIPSLEVGNALLEELGLAYRNYQEKRRITYIIDGVEVDIDFWPMIPPYMEIEGESKEQIDDILEKLELSNLEVVSCNTEEVYKKYGIDIYEYSELKFDGKCKCKQNLLEYNRKMQS